MYVYLIAAVVFAIPFVKIAINAMEPKLIFCPSKISQCDAARLLNGKNKLVSCKIITEDNETLDAIYHKNDDAQKLILFSHGNAGNIYNRLGIVDKFKKLYSVMMFDYRGYGMSTGVPSETGVYNDVYAVWNHCVYILNYNPNNIVLYGESLGCSVVTWLGKHLVENGFKLPRCIILQSGFYNMREIVGDITSKYTGSVISSKFDNVGYVKKIGKNIPIMVIHSTDDEIIDIKHAHKLVSKGKLCPDNFAIISGGHNSPIFDKITIDKINSFID